MSPDLLVALAQFVLTGNALLMLAQSATCVPRITSASMVLGLVTLAAGLLMLSAPISATVVAICAAAWLGIFTVRGRNPNRSQ